MAALRGKKPTALQKRLKCLFFGTAGVGKTTAAIQFPRPYLIDTERGAENEPYAKLLIDRGGAVFQTSDFGEVLEEVTALLTTKHTYRTVIIDPLTIVYNDLVDKSAKSLVTKEDPEGMAFGRHRAKADRQVKHLLNLLLRLDMNVILTAHAKKVYGPNMVELGYTYDCYNKLDYLFDLVFEIQKRGEARVGVVRKTRVPGFVESETFPFTYDVIAEKYGRATLERDATPEKLASPEQVAELQRLVELLKVPSEVTDKWLDKAGADKWAEMPHEAAAKCLSHLQGQIKGE